MINWSIAAHYSIKLKIISIFYSPISIPLVIKYFLLLSPNDSLFNLSSLSDFLSYIFSLLSLSDFLSCITLSVMLWVMVVQVVVVGLGVSTVCGSRCFTVVEVMVEWILEWILRLGWFWSGFTVLEVLWFFFCFVFLVLFCFVFVFVFVFLCGGWQWPVAGSWVLVCGWSFMGFFFFLQGGG